MNVLKEICLLFVNIVTIVFLAQAQTNICNEISMHNLNSAAKTTRKPKPWLPRGNQFFMLV